jgi:hypothetical protein
LGRNKNHINSFITNLKAEMGRKRRQTSKIFGYKEGHTPSHKGKNLDYENNSSSEPFMRLKHGVFESKVTQNSKEHSQEKEHNVCMCDCQDQRLSIQDNHRELQEDSWDEDVATLEDKGIG